MLKRIPLYAKIFLGMFLGIIWGIIAINTGGIQITLDWIKPWGSIFINSLKLIAIPLILVSLIKGIGGISDVSKLSRMGLKTLGLYVLSTIIAVSLGLILVNTLQPGKAFPTEVRENLLSKYQSKTGEFLSKAELTKKSQETEGPLYFIKELVPENIVSAASDNRNMLQVIFFALLFGIAMISVKNKPGVNSVKDFFEGLNEIILKIVDFIMKAAPFGVFALFAAIIVEIEKDNPGQVGSLFIALAGYCATVILGLGIMVFIVYPGLLSIFTKHKFINFLRGIFKAQMLAFSTSSSAATLPVTMDCAERNLGIKKEVSSFVLPIGATINMDGTSLYQGVAAVFIAQAFGMELTIIQQLTIILTATLASIGSAAVPSAGIIMLLIVLESIGVPAAGISLIFAVDRPLDMFRTTVNITGDSAVACVIDYTERKHNNI
ncbi:MAG: dicarboxylate/amino acid:cation symporter [Bacteroidales bacterium]|nr:dicarboxylate/amino acid:cation symporter [Bacteroidales bacterium]